MIALTFAVNAKQKFRVCESQVCSALEQVYVWCMNQQITIPMKTTANKSRCLRAGKFHFLCLILLIGLLFCRSVTAQQTLSPIEEGSSVIDKGTEPSKQVVVQNDSTAKRADSNSYWVDLGLGWGGQGHAFDIGFSYEVVPQRILSLRYTTVRATERFYDYLFYIPIASYPLGKDAGAVEITYGMLMKGE